MIAMNSSATKYFTIGKIQYYVHISKFTPNEAFVIDYDTNEFYTLERLKRPK